MITLKNSLILMVIVAVLGSCEYIESIDKEGDIGSKEITLQPFSAIVVDAPYQITIIKSTKHYVMVQGLDYLIEGVDIEQVDGVISLKHQRPNAIQKSKMLKINIYADDIQSITANAPGQLFVLDTLRGSHLSLVINGSGTYFESSINIDVQSFSLSVFGKINTSTQTIKGLADKAYFEIEGCTYVYADGLVCQQVDFTHKSAANCYVNAVSVLNASIFSGGNLFYRGNPHVNLTIVPTATLSASGLFIPIKN